jgi:hypothetical protein
MKGKWWANHFFRNREANTFYNHLRVQDLGTVIEILGCGCPNYQIHIDGYFGYMCSELYPHRSIQ